MLKLVNQISIALLVNQISISHVINPVTCFIALLDIDLHFYITDFRTYLPQVSAAKVFVLDSSRMEIESQLLPISNITEHTKKCQDIYRIPDEVTNFFGSSNVSSFMTLSLFLSLTK
jgi:hypothetical protein